jgi:hypothetical protein
MLKNLKLSSKMAVIGLLAMVALTVLYGVVFFSNRMVNDNLVVEKMRAEQLKTISNMRLAHLEMVLAAMDSIIDKDEGVVEEERQVVINTNAAILTDNLPTLEALADTAEEKTLARSVREKVEPLNRGIQVDLVKLISESGAEVGQIESAFVSIDDLLDEQSGAVEGSLDELETALRGRLAQAGSAEDLIAAVEMTGHLRATHLELMLAAMDSIIDKEEGKVGTERLGTIEKSLTELKSKESALSALAQTNEEKQAIVTMTDALEKLDKGIRVDLVELIVNSTKKAQALEAAFIKIDDDLDVQGDKVAETLLALRTSAQKRINQTTEQEQKQALAWSDHIAGMQLAHVELMLAAMDSIIDKAEGQINEERQATITELVAAQAENQQTLLNGALSSEEKQLGADLGPAQKQLAQGIQVELKNLIEESSQELKAVNQAFVKIDDDLDEYGDGYADALLLLDKALQQRLAQHDNTRILAAIDLVANLKSFHLTLMLEAMDSIIDKNEGQINEERWVGINGASASFRDKLGKLDKALDTSAEKTLASTLRQGFEKVETGIKKDLKELIEASGIRLVAIQQAFTKIDDVLDEYSGALDQDLMRIESSVQKELNEASATMISGLSTAGYMALAGYLSCGALLITCLVLVTLSIVKPIKGIVQNLTEGSDQVSSASGQVSSASQSLAEGATEQAAGLEETSSSLEEMSSMTKQNADNAQQANTLAAQARKAADNGSESMNRMNTAIQDIQKSSDETAKIIKVIDEIAFQTNLLALNAAVEAARAGEAGKGFAVVAEEVRNLAMRSAEAAKNTSSMIEESVKNANNGVDIAGEVGKVLDEIVGSIGKTTDLVGEIAAASQEQAQGIDQVNTAVAQMDKVTQQNAANAEESASASEELSAQAEQMNTVVEELSAIVGSTNIGKQTRKALSPSKNQARQSDNVLHQIAASRPPATQETRAAKQTIPFDDDMKGFNA